MKTKKIFMLFRYTNFKDIEDRLNDYAKKGLFLQKITKYYWEFKVDEPKDLKYTVTYFSDSSMYDSNKTENQLTYIEYANEYGYEFVEQLDKMQIFVTDADNQIMLETDDREKFENIKACMGKSYIRNISIILIVFLLSLSSQISYVLNSPDTSTFISLSIMSLAILYYGNILVSYILWCKRSEKSLQNGGVLISSGSKLSRLFDKTIYALIIALVLLLPLSYSDLSEGVTYYLIFIQVIFLLLISTKFLNYIKTKNFKRNTVRFLYYFFTYTFMLLYLIGMTYTISKFI